MKWNHGGSVGAALMCALMAVACGQPEAGRPGTEEQSMPKLGTSSAALTVTASYDSTLKVPRCSGVASGCDTGSLVNGRGPVGPELNAPNTLGGTCPDGTTGTYHSDESLERVKVYTTDGSNLAPGKQVTVEVDVWAYSAYSSDALDLYYAADASNPTWTLITTLIPTGPGAQTMRASYTLPTGGSTQALRAAFRYGGSASPCTSSSYDDRDDLAFAVASQATASYDSTLKVPRCSAVASGCDTGSLVNGRGPMGPEFNAPNTLGGTCPDGTTGTYHSDESVDRVKVYTTDGSNLAPGKQVTVEVDVWAYSAYSSDALDLYYAADANNPTWTLITTLIPTGPGAQTMRASYTLPMGGSTQAVRAAFRYGGSASPCTSSSYDDRDDLAFAVPSQATSSRIAAGYHYNLKVRQDGTVWAWGANSYGQLGDGTTTQRTTPVQVVGLDNVGAVAAGDTHSLALKKDGTVWAWGHNEYGKLGDGTTTTRHTPVQLAGLTNVVAIDAKKDHSLAVKKDGTVWAWGNNAYGKLGDGTTMTRYTPVQVVGLSGVVSVAAGWMSSQALKQDGTVWGWGFNEQGQLGDGTIKSKLTPVQVVGLTGATLLVAGDLHALAVKQDGTAWGWGNNETGQLGDGTTTTRLTPVQVSGLSGVTSIDTSYGHSLAVRQDGTVWGWGSNYVGQLGDGTTTQRLTPVQVPAFSGVVVIRAGGMHSLALQQDDSTWAWGYNYSGQLGNGSIWESHSPVKVLE
ncbi:hypothetical protein [Archangium sp.]|uniref:RCC1 domain-containing protein n=1 Tax=Archangium sp. TaxID=1872627 RepID=UPI00286BF690|nr:hypothetical protein [Archangium sp.]